MNTNKITLLIAFRGITGKHIVQLDELAQCIKSNNKYGIDFIKEFDAPKDKFVRVSKDRIRMWTDFDTECIIELQKTGYIK